MIRIGYFYIKPCKNILEWKFFSVFVLCSFFSSSKNKIAFDSCNAAPALDLLWRNDHLFYLNTMSYNSHLISLWFSSTCHSDSRCFTLHWRLLTVDFHLCTIPTGSILNSNKQILSCWTCKPLLSKKPLRILIPIPGYSSHASLVSSWSWLSSMVLYFPTIIRQYHYWQGFHFTPYIYYACRSLVLFRTTSLQE